MRKKLVFHLGHSAGFYSEFNNMVLAILYCQYNDIEFMLYSSDANFGVENGWDDFFVPFCKESRNNIHHYINNRFSKPTGRKNKLLLAFYKLFHPNVFLTYELWDKVRHMDVDHPVREIQMRCSKIVDSIYKFNLSTLRRIEDLERQVSIDGPYVGFHIRRGDKDIEHNQVAVSEYIAAAVGVSGCERAFVASDDYAMVQAIKSGMPDTEVYTLVPADEHGYVHQSYMQQSKEEKSQKLMLFLAQMDLLYKSEAVVCTYSSNVGMFLGIRKMGKTVGVDYHDWLIW